MPCPVTTERLGWSSQSRRDWHPPLESALPPRLAAADFGGVVVAHAVPLAGVRRKADTIVIGRTALLPDAERLSLG